MQKVLPTIEKIRDVGSCKSDPWGVFQFWESIRYHLSFALLVTPQPHPLFTLEAALCDHFGPNQKRQLNRI